MIASDDEIRKILVERIDVQHRSVGIVVGVIGPEGRRVIAYGHLDEGDTRPVNDDTVYEIGSITKVFTSLLLADMVQHGEVSLDDPVAKYLPPTVKMPERNGRSITLVDLATHTSGLPTPQDFNPKDIAGYFKEQLYEFLSNCQLTRDIGSQFEYSGLGYALLGHALERKTDVDYESLVRSRICEPLGMKDTRIELTPEMKIRLAAGHNAAMKTVPNWDWGASVFAGEGALRSTVNDLLIFLSANLGIAKSPLAPAMAAMLKVRRLRVPHGTEEIALAWVISTRDGKEIIYHEGGTGGYRSWMGYDARARAGVVVLSNAAEGVVDIGRHLLDASFHLAKPHTEVQVDTRLFDGYVGNYQFRPDIVLTISREGDRLFAQITWQAKFELFPESDRECFYKAVDAQLTFVTGDDGRATELILHQGGRDSHAKRID